MAMTAREPLSRDRILHCALQVVDDEGLGALSMRRLGHELGVEAMSLYHHVPNKRALLEGIVDTVLGELVVPPPEAGDWSDRVRAVARSYRSLAHAHPHAFPLLIAAELKTPESLRTMERMIDLCREAGFPDEDATLDAFCTLGSFVSGFALFEIGGFLALAADETAASSRAAEGNTCGAAFPRLMKDMHGDAQFEFGLDVILAGLEARRERHAGSFPVGDGESDSR